MGLEEKVSAVRQWMPGLDKEKAKYVVLKSMGIDSGTKKEAFLRMTMKRAMLLKMMADKGSVLPEKTVQAMNLKKTKDHEYSLQAIAMGMGIGTMFSAVSVIVYQGILVALAALMSSILE